MGTKTTEITYRSSDQTRQNIFDYASKNTKTIIQTPPYDISVKTINHVHLPNA